MYDRRLVAGLLLVLAPVVSDAQRRVRGERNADWDKITAREAEPSILTRKEVESMDPVKHLVAKRKDLKLTDAQFAALKAMDDSAKARDDGLFQQMDSLRKEFKPAAAGDDMARLRRQVVQREFAATVVKIRENYDASAAAAVAALDEAQRPQAEALLGKQKEMADELVGEKMGGRRGPPGGGGAPPRRP